MQKTNGLLQIIKLIITWFTCCEFIYNRAEHLSAYFCNWGDISWIIWIFRVPRRVQPRIFRVNIISSVTFLPFSFFDKRTTGEIPGTLKLSDIRENCSLINYHPISLLVILCTIHAGEVCCQPPHTIHQ